jgi:gamma-glutamyltranspeptidase/glutathione hydrolase
MHLQGRRQAGRYLEEKPTRGPLTVTIPGLVYLWGQLYEEYASLSFDRLLKPAIDLACNGFNAAGFYRIYLNPTRRS